MAEIATVARPYAEALFRAALDANALGAVAESLALAAAIEKDETMRAVLLNPKVKSTGAITPPHRMAAASHRTSAPAMAGAAAPPRPTRRANSNAESPKPEPA